MSYSRWSVLPDWHFRVLPRDSKSIITCVFLGLAMAVLLQITERIDLAITGGTIPIVSAVVVCAIWSPAALFYGVTGALITAWINPIISNLTASQPMAPFLFLTNISHTLPLVLLTLWIKPKMRGLSLLQFLVINQIAGLCDAAMFGIGNAIILHMPFKFILFQIAVIQPCYLLGGLVSYLVLRRLINSGLVTTAGGNNTVNTI